eukprot:7986159-Prorocentrum_lima.AAC.1
MTSSLVGSEMCIRDRLKEEMHADPLFSSIQMVTVARLLGLDMKSDRRRRLPTSKKRRAQARHRQKRLTGLGDPGYRTGALTSAGPVAQCLWAVAV